jgi:hypothetical protein
MPTSTRRITKRADVGLTPRTLLGELEAVILGGMGRDLRRELRRKRRAFRRAYEEAFGCRHRPMHRIVPYSRVLAVAGIAGCLTAVFTLLGFAIWVVVPAMVAFSVAGAIVQEHLNRPCLSFRPPPSPGDGPGRPGVREPRKPSPRGESPGAAVR